MAANKYSENEDFSVMKEEQLQNVVKSNFLMYVPLDQEQPICNVDVSKIRIFVYQITS
jgi:uncharacterized protein YcgL (UPF0745 family)